MDVWQCSKYASATLNLVLHFLSCYMKHYANATWKKLLKHYRKTLKNMKNTFKTWYKNCWQREVQESFVEEITQSYLGRGDKSEFRWSHNPNHMLWLSLDVFSKTNENWCLFLFNVFEWLLQIFQHSQIWYCSTPFVVLLLRMY